MTSRERIDALLHGTRPDRIALDDSPWDDALGLWMAEGYPTRLVSRTRGDKRWREDGQCVVVERPGAYPEPAVPWKVFGYDMAAVGGWFDCMPRRGVNELVEESDEWEVRRNGAGAAFKYWKRKSGTPEHVDFLMSSREIWDRDYRHLLLDLDPARIDTESARTSLADARAAGVWAHYGHLGVWEALRSSLGDIALYESLLLDPDWIRDIVDVYTVFFTRHFDRLIDTAGMPDGIWIYDDLGYRNGLFASPSVLDRLIFPFHRSLVRHFHDRGLPVILHSCGSQVEALPLIVDAGFDALNPMERKAEGNDPFLFAERYGDRLAFIGGFDARILETNDCALVRREVGAYLEGMKARGARLVFGSDHSLSPRIRLSTYRTALDAYRQHMSYA